MLIDRAAERSARLMLEPPLELATRFHEPLFAERHEDHGIDLRIEQRLPAIHVSEKARRPAENWYRFLRRRRLRDCTRRCEALQQHNGQQARQDSLPLAAQALEIAK